MPYKIYTYEDPYKLDQTDFWEEISELPHFCSARTLVNGLKNVLGDKIKGLICPLDDLVGHEEVYKNWTDNVSQHVHQYSVLTGLFGQLLEKNKIDKSFSEALKKNQNHMLDAMRLFIELGIPAKSIDKTKGNLEQRLFRFLLEKVEGHSLFQFPQTPNKEKIRNIIIRLAAKELEECRGPEREIERCKRAVGITQQLPFTKIVVHGVHQFSTVQLRLLLAMEKMGITVIFLFNYQKQFSKIYSSWNEIYSCFDVPIHHDAFIKEYQMPTMQNPSNALACAIGTIFEESTANTFSKIKKWHKLYESVELLEFANITEYAHFVSLHFDEAEKKYDQSRSVLERGSHVWNRAAVLGYLDEQIYTANRDVHTLLKIYYPDYTKDRHFLAYPIGQFFSAIYRLWDYERGEIKFDIPAIKECLNSNVLTVDRGEVLLKTFYNLEVLFENISSYTDFMKEIGKVYLQNYERVQSAKGNDPLHELKRLSIYNKYVVTKKDIVMLISAIKEINEIASGLFALDHTHEDFISFGRHFQNLEEFLRNRELELATEQERALIYALQLRLEKIHPEKSRFSGTFRDLREGLYFYLKQKEDQEPGVDWIVKNFEQIDGDILQSKSQFEHDRKKTYHFACLSDRDMNMTVNDQLPWPLTEEYIRVAYAPVDLQFQVYYTSLSVRSNFLLYALFYGLCYNRCDVRLSYVKQYGDEITEPYALLSVLGFTDPKIGVVKKEQNEKPFGTIIAKEKLKDVKYVREEMMDMFLCPYRYFMDYVMENEPVVKGDFLYKKFYENTLVSQIWKRIEKWPKSKVEKMFPQILKEENEKIRQYFNFWKETEIYDLKSRAYNYVLHWVIENSTGTIIKQYQPSHMNMRKIFGKAKFDVDSSAMDYTHPYPSFEALAKVKGNKKEYSLHRVPKLEKPEEIQLSNKLQKEVALYLNDSENKGNCELPGEWCQYCGHRGNCMVPYLVEE